MYLRGVPSPIVVKRWYKRLPAADAQQLPSSSPSAALTLVAAGHPIDISTYFRNDFFRDAAWAPDGNKEIAEIDCQVVVDGTPIGVRRMTVVHHPPFEAGQGNRSTLLRWGQLHPYLLGHDHTGDVVTLERLSDGSCRVLIAPNSSGAFIP